MKAITSETDTMTTWIKAAPVEKFSNEGGACIKHGNEQIAIFNFTSRGEWYATQNMCPHKKEMALSRGMIGDKAGEPKVACPFHKKQFSLKSGECMDDNECDHIKTYPVKVENGIVYVGINS